MGEGNSCSHRLIALYGMVELHSAGCLCALCTNLATYQTIFNCGFIEVNDFGESIISIIHYAVAARQ